MNTNTINLSEITLEKSIKNSFDIKYNNNTIEFWTPLLLIPFGVDNKYNNFFLNCELDNDSNTMKLFEYFIEQLESKFIELLNIKKYQLNSQLRYTDTNSILYTKFLEKGKQIVSIIKDSKNNYKTIYDIEKNMNCKLKLCLNKLWFKNDKYYYKYSIKEIILE